MAIGAQRAVSDSTKVVSFSGVISLHNGTDFHQVEPSVLMQPDRYGGFSAGYTDIGPVVGLGNLGSASAAFGGRLEHAIKPLPDMGGGILGLEAAFDYYSWSNSLFSYKYIPIGVTANYHFKLDEPNRMRIIESGMLRVMHHHE